MRFVSHSFRAGGSNWVGNAVCNARFNSPSDRAPKVTAPITSRPSLLWMFCNSIDAFVRLGNRLAMTPVFAPASIAATASLRLPILLLID